MSAVLKALSKSITSRSNKNSKNENEEIQLRLLEACKNGNIDMVNECISKCQNDLNVINYQHARSGFTPLKYASYYGFDKIVSILVNIKGIDINHCYSGNYKNKKSFDFESALFLSVIQCHKNPTKYMKIIDLLYENGADINIASTVWFITPLFSAIKYENIELFKYLISKPEININGIKSRNGWNALHFASFYNSKQCEILSILLQFDAISMINGITKDGSTCLHLLIKSWPIMNDIQLKKCKLLIEYGADITINDCHHKKPLDYTDKKNKLLLLKYSQKHVDNVRYLILNKKGNFEIMNGQKQLPSAKYRYICDYSIQCINKLPVEEIQIKDFAYYREVTLKRTNRRLIANKSKKEWFMFVIFIKSNAIPEKLRLSLLYNLSKLAQDNMLLYDLRDIKTGIYLNSLSSQFDPRRSALDSDDEKQSIIPFYHKQTILDKYGCMTYTIMNDDKSIKTNTAFIHDLIDPNNTFNDHHKLWIPTLFDCLYKYDVADKQRDINKLIKSPILNLDYIKYRDLYINIGDIFKMKIQQSFEKLLGLKLGCNEKIIIKCMKYILQKPGDQYNGNLHREGLGENIIALSIYYPSIVGHKYMKNGQLTISLITESKKNRWDKEKILSHKFDIVEGGVITFYNEGLHQLKNITYIDIKNGNKSNKGPISRTILAFFLISPLDKNKNIIKDSNDNKLKVNFIYYWKYCISYWLNHVDHKWLNDIIYKYLFGIQGYNRFGYKKRARMKKEKSRELTYNMITGYSISYSGGECDWVNYDIDDYITRRLKKKKKQIKSKQNDHQLSDDNYSDSNSYQDIIQYPGYRDSDSLSDDGQFLL